MSLKDLLNKDTLLYQYLPHFVMEIARRYFRVEVEGYENIPKRGAAVIAPNHSGFTGLDALLMAHLIYKNLRRIPRVLTHKFWFLTPATSVPAQKLGFTEATFDNGVNALERNNLVIIFPEGEQGNFKPSSEKYRLQEFKTGFIRMAIRTQSPIIPTLVIGAEEAHINLSTLRLSKFLRGTVLPIPLNPIPLPTKWKIVFLPPVSLPYEKDAADDTELVKDVASDLQEKMQEALTAEVQRRGIKIF